MTEVRSTLRAQDAFTIALDVLQASADIGLEERGGFNMAAVQVDRLLAKLPPDELVEVAAAIALLSRLTPDCLADSVVLDRVRVKFIEVYS